MPGNEYEVSRFLFENLNKITLSHIGLITQIGAPGSYPNSYSIIGCHEDLDLIKTQDANKKADIYINDYGVSLKQSGASFPFNRLQRSEMLDVFRFLNIDHPEQRLAKIDSKIDDFHLGKLQGRSRPWSEFFTEQDFKLLVKYLMMEGSPNNGLSTHPANFILEAPAKNIAQNNLEIFTFDEYFEKYSNKFKFAIRRQWIGQSSDSEHRRAFGISQKEGNKRWVFNDVQGSPRISRKSNTKWRDDVPEIERKTVYMIFIEKI